MMKLNCKVVARLFFDAPVAPDEMPVQIEDIFRWTDHGEGEPVRVVSMDFGVSVESSPFRWARKERVKSGP